MKTLMHGNCTMKEMDIQQSILMIIIMTMTIVQTSHIIDLNRKAQRYIMHMIVIGSIGYVIIS